MDDHNVDPELQGIDRYLATLSRRVEPDSTHHARLRQELLRRHRELRTDTTQRAVPMLWSRLTGLKRLTLVAPPALAAAVALFAVLSGAQISGHRSTQTADAAQITNALAHSAPTVTAWRVSVQHLRGNSAASVQCPYALGRNQHFFVRDGHAYFYDGHRWYRVSASLAGGDSQCPLDLQWAFAILPAHLESGRFTMLSEKVVQGRRMRGVRYTVRQAGSAATTTEWVDITTGLVARAVRVVVHAGHVVERDVATYGYSRV